MTKKWLSALLTLVMVFTLLPVMGTEARAESIVQERLNDVISEFPEGSYFTTDGNANSSGELTDVLRARGLNTSGFDKSWTCLAFAKYVWARLFGHNVLPQYRIEIGSSKDGAQVAWSKAQPGDLVYFYTDSACSNWKHAAIFLKRAGNSVFFVDCNYDHTNQIKYYSATIGGWGWPYSYYEIFRANDYDVINASTGETHTVHQHSYYRDYEAAHPHRVFMKCSSCGEFYYTGETTTYSACEICNAHQHSYYYDWEIEHPHRVFMKCSSCGEFYYIGETSYYSGCEICNPPHTHTLTHTAAKDATETTTGNTEYWYCNGCGKYFSDANALNEIPQSQTIVAKHGHTHGLANFTYNAPKLPTCTESGNCLYWICSCGKYFLDTDGAREITLSETVIAPLGHDYINGKCSRCGAADPSKTTTAINVSFDKINIYYQGQFSDVPAEQWFTKSIADAFELGLMKGDSGNTFNPYGDVTVAEAITMAARIHSIYTTGSEDFNQSVGNAWYQTYLDYAYDSGVISRAYYNSDVTQKATRAQFAEIFANSLPAEALAAINSIGDDAIPDVSMSSQIFAPYVYKLYRAGILTGGDALGTFSPQTYITRAEAAAIVSRMAESDNRVSFTLR